MPRQVRSVSQSEYDRTTVQRSGMRNGFHDEASCGSGLGASTTRPANGKAVQGSSLTTALMSPSPSDTPVSRSIRSNSALLNGTSTTTANAPVPSSGQATARATG
jgi:hypothetical protein